MLNEKLNISRHQPSADKSVQVNRKSPKFNLLPENLFREFDIRLGFVCSMSIMPVQSALFHKPEILFVSMFMIFQDLENNQSSENLRPDGAHLKNDNLFKT